MGLSMLNICYKFAENHDHFFIYKNQFSYNIIINYCVLLAVAQKCAL